MDLNTGHVILSGLMASFTGPAARKETKGQDKQGRSERETCFFSIVDLTNKAFVKVCYLPLPCPSLESCKHDHVSDLVGCKIFSRRGYTQKEVKREASRYRYASFIGCSHGNGNVSTDNRDLCVIDLILCMVMFVGLYNGVIYHYSILD